jgi:hypothetical protein
MGNARSTHRRALTLAAVLLGALGAHAQCGFGGTLNAANATPTSCPGSASVACVTGGQYVLVNVVAGNTYTFSTCGGATWDTQITLFNNATTANVGYNDDGCGVQSTVTWTATFTGQVRVLVNQFFCTTNGTCATLNVSCTAGASGPANDNPCGATPLTVGTSCSFTTGNTTGATATTGPPAPTCASYLGNDVWFSAVVPASGQLTIDSNTGTITDGGMALYTAPSCSGPFTQVACDDDGSANGLMPLINATGLTPGSTVYIRFWRYGGGTGTFSICAFGNNVTPPPGGCIYTLTLNDSFGDGWGTSSVGISINGGAYTWYSVVGSSNTVSIPVGIGNIIAVQYNNSGAWQGENSYNLTLNGGLLFASGSPPTAGLVWTNTVTCQTPPAPPEDCVGGITICSGQNFNNATTNTGAIADLTLATAGCLGTLERQGTWYNFTPSSGGTIGFTINPADPTDDYDFALWGPFPTGSNPSTICPPLGAPLRCSFSALDGATGMNATATDLSEDPSGDKWVQQITVTTGQVYLLYISNFSQSGLSFGLTWQLGGGASLDCTVLPVGLLTLTATPAEGKVLVDWSTAQEQGTAHHEVERAMDGVNFTPVGRVTAAGDATSPSHYHFTDEHPADGLNYYRLRTVDIDGSSSLSNTVTAWNGQATAPLKVVPNPATEQASVVLSLPADGTHLLRVLDAQGRSLLEQPLAGMGGTNTVALDLGHLVVGPYQVVVARPDGEVLGRARFVKQ